MKSLLLLSALFSVSLDILIKGDLEEVKEKIKTEDIVGFKHDGISLVRYYYVLFYYLFHLNDSWGILGLEFGA